MERPGSVDCSHRVGAGGERGARIPLARRAREGAARPGEVGARDEQERGVSAAG